MPQPECERLDAYLNCELSQHEVAQFTAHLGTCADCTEAIDQQRWLDDLLRGTGTAEAVPAEVYAGIDRAIVRRRRRRQLGYGFAAAAAVLLVAFTFQSTPHTQPTEQSQLTTNHQPPITPVATFVGTDDMIVVRHESPYPNVTIVEVFPTVAAQRRWKTKAKAYPSLPPRQPTGDPS